MVIVGALNDIGWVGVTRRTSKLPQKLHRRRGRRCQGRGQRKKSSTGSGAWCGIAGSAANAPMQNLRCVRLSGGLHVQCSVIRIWQCDIIHRLIIYWSYLEYYRSHQLKSMIVSTMMYVPAWCTVAYNVSSICPQASRTDKFSGCRPWRGVKERRSFAEGVGIVTIIDPDGKVCGICVNVWNITGHSFRIAIIYGSDCEFFLLFARIRLWCRSVPYIPAYTRR